jgi:GSH-dependent disulfide-bond oxidoreductase
MDTITMFLEEAGFEYRIHPVDISAGDQFKPEFLAFSPSNRIPAIIDTTSADGGEAITVFESGAILTYLAEKTGRFLPADLRGRKNVMEWLFWQMGGLGPMAGQNHHFERPRARKTTLCNRPVRQGNQPIVRRARPQAGWTRLHCGS